MNLEQALLNTPTIKLQKEKEEELAKLKAERQEIKDKNRKLHKHLRRIERKSKTKSMKKYLKKHGQETEYEAEHNVNNIADPAFQF